MASRARLIYFDGRGRAEIIRLMLCAVKVDFEEVFLTEREEFLKLCENGKLQFKQVPVLEYDGQTYSQSAAIVRHLARKFNMYGADLEESAKVDILFEGTRDWYMPLLGIIFYGDEASRVGSFKNSGVERYLAVYEMALKESSSGYLVGSSPTLADIGLLDVTFAIEDFLGMDYLKDYPKLQAFHETLAGRPEFVHYKQQVRKNRNDEAYVANVKKVLAW